MKNVKSKTMEEKFGALLQCPPPEQLVTRVQMQQCKFLSVSEAAFYLGFPTVKRFQDEASTGRFDRAISLGGNGRQFHRETLDRLMLQNMKQTVNA